MNDTQTDGTYEKPWWARMSFWFFLGSFVATMTLGTYQRAVIFKVVRAYLPAAKAAGKTLAKEAKSLADRQASPEEEDVNEPSSVNLSAPVDPSKNFAKVPVGARIQSTSRARRMMRDVRGKGRKSAGEVAEVRQYMNAPKVSYERQLTFWETDLGLGIAISLCISAFFFVIGYNLFQVERKGSKNLS